MLSGADFEWNESARYNRGSKQRGGSDRGVGGDVGWRCVGVSRFPGYCLCREKRSKGCCSTRCVVSPVFRRYRSIDRSFLRYSRDIDYEISFEVWRTLFKLEISRIEWTGFLNKDDKCERSVISTQIYLRSLPFSLRSSCRLVDLSQPGPITANSMGGIARLHKL